MSSTEPVYRKIFISYAHETPEHKERVLNLCNRLRSEGVDCWIDQYEESPPEGWARWTMNRVLQSDLVLVICTPTYERRVMGTEEAGKGLGVKWEGAVITQELYDRETNNTKFIPVTFSAADEGHVPIMLRSATIYNISAEEGYLSLYRRLTQQPRVVVPQLGQVRAMPPRQPAPPPSPAPPSAEPRLSGSATAAPPPVQMPPPLGQTLPPVVQTPPPAAEAPPPKTAARLSGNLPAPVTPFIGREKDIAEWCALLRQETTRLLTLSGFGGIGKSRAALQIAKLCASDFPDTRYRADFPDGVWWVDLPEVRTGEQMINQIAYCLHLTVQPQPSVKEQLLNFLREQQLLLVLDGTEQIPDAAVVVNELLKSVPRLKCLVASRRSLELQEERLVEVLPLPLSDAEQLFVERARARQAGFVLTADNAAAVAAICRRLEGVPLAIELAAARVRTMSPRDILSRLNERFDILQSRVTDPDQPPRQRALRGAIDWSYDLLTDEDKSLFAQLSVFVGGFTMADAEAVCDAPDVPWGVEELLAHSLLRAQNDPVTQQVRFSMLELVRYYAADKLKESGEAGQLAGQRHAEHFLRFAQERLNKVRTSDEVTSLQELGVNFGNLRVAMDWAQQAGKTELCAELALALGTYLQRCGFQKEAVQRIQAGLRTIEPSKAQHRRLYAHLLRERAVLHLDQFEWADADSSAREAMALLEDLDDPKGEADLNLLLGQAAAGQKNFTEARLFCQCALEQFERVGDETGVAIVRNSWGVVEYEDEQGSKDEADRHWQEALQIRHEHGDGRGIAETTTNLGVLAKDRGRLGEAWGHYQQAIQFEKELQHVFGVGRALFNLGEVAELEGELKRAYRLFAAAESIFDKIGSPYKRDASDCLQSLASSLNAQGVAAPPHENLKNQTLDDLIAWALTAPDDDPPSE